jgi:outer membrane lipoprotein-sorting protein
MKIVPFVYLAAVLHAPMAAGQSDPQAIKILDRFSFYALKAPSVSMEFRMITTDLTENTSDTLDGSIILCKDKYKLILSDNITLFNGETIWNYLPAENEVTITRPDNKDHSFQNHPSEIFNMYKSGYKSRLIEEKTDSDIIDLYPEDIKSDLVRVSLSLNKSNLNLQSLEYKRRDGMIITLHIREYNLKLKPDPDTFVFQADKYKGVEVNDMR